MGKKVTQRPFAPSPGCVDSGSKGATRFLSAGLPEKGIRGEKKPEGAQCSTASQDSSETPPHGLTCDSLVCRDFQDGLASQGPSGASQLDRGVAMETLWSICCPDCEEGQSPVFLM